MAEQQQQQHQQHHMRPNQIVQQLPPFEESNERPVPFGCAWGPSLGSNAVGIRDTSRRALLDPPRFHITASKPIGVFRTEDLSNGPFPLGEADNQYRILYQTLRSTNDQAGLRDLRATMKRRFFADSADGEEPLDPAASWRGPPALPASHLAGGVN